MIPSDDDPPPDLSPSDQQKAHDFKISCDGNDHASVSDIDLFVADLDVNNNPQSSFSIRDYVFNSRSKNIGRNWPFSHKILQICLKHEVKNILPPFQSLESVRNKSPNEETISCCEKSKLELTLEFKKSKKLSQTNPQQDLGQTKSKKTEAATAMASKICPVCKIFSSSSNTTLNAHIDQCLSGESTMKWTANPEVIIKHKVKPRKMRLMVDIYKTAPHCTVEELDAINGTSWANNTSFPDQEIEFEATTIVDHEGDAYSGNNRTNVPKSSVPKATNNTSNDGSQKKGEKSVKVFLWKKKSKTQERKHDQKYLKQSPNSKNSSSEITANVGNGENCNKEATNNDDLPIVRPPWACSKRTGLAKTNMTVASDKSFSNSGFKPASSSSNKMEILLQKNSQETIALTPSRLLFAKKRSLLLTKQSSKNLKKRGTILHNSCVDPSNSCLVKVSDVRLKGSNNLSSVNSKTTSKINLKRKFSALERRQDSLKHKSWIKEDTSGKTSCKSMNILEVKKNEKMEICRPENPFFSRSLNEDSSRLKHCIADPSCGIESVIKEALSNEEQVSSMQVLISSDNMFNSRERVINAPDDIEREPPPYHGMSDSPNSTVSNPSLPRSDSKNDEKSKSSGDWRSNGQSQTTSFKNDHQPCCCSRKEIASSQTLASSTYHDQSTLLRKHDVESFNFKPQMLSISKFPTSSPPPLPPPVKLPTNSECDSAVSPSKPVIRLMGKNLTVVNTDEDKVNCGQFPNAQNRYHFYTFPSDAMFQSTTYANYYAHGSRHVGPMIPANQDRKNSPSFNNGGFQACSPFMEVENNNNLTKWNCKPATGSSRSSANYYPSSFS